GHQARCMAELLLVHFERGEEQIAVAWPLVVDLVVRDDLLFGLLELDHLAEFGRLTRLALANDLGLGLEQADDLARSMRIALVDAFACLANDLLNAGDHRLEVLALGFDRLVVVSAIAAFNAIDQLSHKAAGFADHALSNRQQPAVALDHPLPSLLTPAARRAAGP